MKIELLIYAYLAICTAMILFNCACLFVFRRRDHLLQQRSTRLTNEITGQIRLLQRGGTVAQEHLDLLRKKLCRIGNLMAFDETLETLSGQSPEAARAYLSAIHPVFPWIVTEHRYRSAMQLAYFAYVLGKYPILSEQADPPVTAFLLQLLEEPSLYCRENALQAIYSTGNCDLVLQALRQVDESGRFHHGKLLTNGLLTFSGDRQELTRMLWDSFDAVSLSMQTVILDYIRFSGSRMDEELLPLLAEEGRDDELRFSCIRYFEKHPDPRAYPLLLSFLEHPGERTVLALKWAMGSASWYIRLNAARSLTSFHLTYQNLGDVMDSGDRYARESLQYRLDLQQAQQAPKKQERQEVALV